MLAIGPIESDPLLSDLVRRVSASREGVVHATGLWGSSAPVVAAAIARTNRRPLLYVTAHLEEADDARDDIELFLGRSGELLPAWESLPGEGASDGEIEAERLRIASTLSRASAPVSNNTPSALLVAPVQALLQPLPDRAALLRNTLQLSTGANRLGVDALSPDVLLRWAIDRGLERLDLVESPGDVARRGDIVDLFVPGETHPFRIQFFGDDIESIRRIDIGTQRSIETLTDISLTLMRDRDWLTDESRTDLLAYLPADTVILLDSPIEIQEMGATLERRMGDTEFVRPVSELLARFNDFTQVHLSRFAGAVASDDAVVDFAVSSLARFEGDGSGVIAELIRLANDHDVYVVCDNEGERERLLERIAEHTAGPTDSDKSRDRKGAVPFSERIHTEIGILHRGFEWTRTHTIVVPHHELFHRSRQRRRVRRIYAGRPVETWTDLTPGEYVVHVVYGIAVYRGLHRMRKTEGGQQEEFLTLEFAGKAVVHVPCSQIDLVQKYIGSAGHRPQLSKLGGKRWSRIKEEVADSVSELAGSLLQLQAMRASAEGTAYPADTEWQREFEAAFVYEETEDQLQVAEEIRDDLMRRRPMDRLICGDVGYGKTELAMRAAFKVLEFGRQAAVLVPTTVLAEQHYETFKERMGDYPFRVGCLSRFRTGAEQKKLVEQVKKGQVDIVIGTHRLLSKDVAFSDLGLIIIDEEQRFGVEHKERLKSMRATVDILTLTATPIPRTLHMSMIGLRDISSLQTPPIDRRAIATQVRVFDKKLIRDAILRELNRDGQVFFVHNFVRSIAAMTAQIQQIVPEARIVYGHGQMKDDELESVMHKFASRQADILVSTTIIESGIDISTANTIFINRADRFGLADLHQLRGRVGRSEHRAYCYLLLSPDVTPTSKAGKRLKTIEEFSELGAGFRIAMRDLEIRGAGNLLGKEQSGHIAAVGYEMYCQLLEQAVRRMKNEPDLAPKVVHLDLDVSAHLPSNYITAERARIEVYRRIVSCRTPKDLSQLEADLRDAFGPYPKQVEILLELAEIRVHCRRFGILSVSRRPPDVIFVIEDMMKAKPVFADAPGSVRIPDAKTIHLRLPPAYIEPTSLVPVLRRMLVRAVSPVERTTPAEATT